MDELGGVDPMGQIQVCHSVDGIDGLCVITPKVHGDSRGYFMETYNQKDMQEAGLNITFVQDNQSMSKKGVLRGLHFQIKYPQTKLVRVIKGEVFDVAVDLRIGSPTYGRYHGEFLSEQNKKQYLIPRGFAHGFLVLSEVAIILGRVGRYHPLHGGADWRGLLPLISVVLFILKSLKSFYLCNDKCSSFYELSYSCFLWFPPFLIPRPVNWI